MISTPKFGFVRGRKVELHEFRPDQDGTTLLWYKSTGKFERIAGREKIGHRSARYEGHCSDTAEYTSHLGELAQQLVRKAPEGTRLVAIVDQKSGSGTRTFSERLIVDYYAR